MPTIRILSDCKVAGKHTAAGSIIDASQEDADILIGSQRGELEGAASAPPVVTKAALDADLDGLKAAQEKLAQDLKAAGK